MLFDALEGIRIAWREERNFRFHIIFSVLVLIAAWVLRLTRAELLVILVLIGIVLMAETFNTALEELCDKFQPEHDPHIGKIKDLAAGAVLITAVTALVIGLIIFVPHIANFA